MKLNAENIPKDYWSDDCELGYIYAVNKFLDIELSASDVAKIDVEKVAKMFCLHICPYTKCFQNAENCNYRKETIQAIAESGAVVWKK